MRGECSYQCVRPWANFVQVCVKPMLCSSAALMASSAMRQRPGAPTDLSLFQACPAFTSTGISPLIISTASLEYYVDHKA